ncbi:zinc finger protein 33B isoform X2 [Manduca sexta]|uniref:zinc finger protein 33B isoform X2 n=1 Tax=Manduca sexta TaxID=7130 RepID=UPI00188FEC82|nr:zinc finger protein 33B isoform X2 [Manduca sexta]
MATEQIFLMNSDNSHPSPTTQKPFEMSEEPIQMDIESIHDFSNVCRTCAAVSEFVIPIFEGEGLQNNLADKISKHLPIQVSETDMLPRVVCYQCASTLLAWHELVSCCVQADAALRTRMPVPYADQATTTKQENCQNSNKIPEEKFKDMSSFRAPPRDPPKYAEISTCLAVAEPTKPCRYCKAKVAEHVYQDHLIGAHSLLVSFCDKCHIYIDRKVFGTHMMEHAMSNKRRNRDRNQNSHPPPNYPTPAMLPYIFPDDEESSDNLADKSDMNNKSGPISQSKAGELSKNQPDIKPKAETADTKSSIKAKWSRSCPICSKPYTAPSSFFYHMKHSHSAAKEHECDVCGKKFTSKANLAQHVAIHADEYKYSCKSCDKRFKTRASLYIHSQTHACPEARPAPHACDACGRRFRWRAALKRHAARHADARAHSCDTCSRAFSVRGDLLRHARTHAAGAAACACPHCGLEFAQQRYLNVHVANKHSPNKRIKKEK